MTGSAPFDFASARDVSLLDETSLWSSLAGQLLLEHVPLAGVRRALDLGCGPGFPLVELAERLGPGALVVGADPWETALARAAAKLARWGAPGACVRADGAALPLRTGALDLVVSNLGVNNFADPAAAFRECRRVLRPGGSLVLSTNLVGHMRELYEVFERVLAEAADAVALERLRAHVAHRATVSALRGSLEAAGLHVTAVREREVPMRFAGATALLSHHFIRLGFRPAWEEVAGEAGLAPLAAALDRAAGGGPITLTVPLAVVAAELPA